MARGVFDRESAPDAAFDNQNIGGLYEKTPEWFLERSFPAAPGIAFSVKQ